jgi:hypothetical protein
MNDFFGSLESQLRTAAVRPARRLPELRSLPAAALALALLAIAVVPLLVLTGRDEPGPALRGDPQSGLPNLPNRTVVANGEASVAGPWKLLDYDSERLSDPATGEEYQPAGLSCLGIFLSNPAPRASAGFSGQCGDFPRTPGFSRVQHTVRDEGGAPREILLYGRVPEEASSVTLTGDGLRLSGDGQAPIVIEPIAGPPGIPGDFYLVALKPGLEGGRVNWIDGAGREGSRGIALLPP